MKRKRKIFTFFILALLVLFAFGARAMINGTGAKVEGATNSTYSAGADSSALADMQCAGTDSIHLETANPIGAQLCVGFFDEPEPGQSGVIDWESY